MHVKGAFDHISKEQLLTRMIELGIDGDLVTWTDSFLIDRKLQLVIDPQTIKYNAVTRAPAYGTHIVPGSPT